MWPLFCSLEWSFGGSGLAACWTNGFYYSACCEEGSTCFDDVFTPKWCCSQAPASLADLVATLRLEPVQHKVVNFGAGDGVSAIPGCANCSDRDPCFGLYESGFHGLAVDADQAYLEALEINLPWPRVAKRIINLNPVSAVDLLHAWTVVAAGEQRNQNEVAVLKIDLDSVDCSILLAVLDSGYRPLVVQIEINVEVPLPVVFGVHQGDAYYGVFGCSVALAAGIMRRSGYSLVGVAPLHDLLFVQTEHWPWTSWTDAQAFVALQHCCKAATHFSALPPSGQVELARLVAARGTADPFMSLRFFAGVIFFSCAAARARAGLPEGDCSTRFTLGLSVDDWLSEERNMRNS